MKKIALMIGALCFVFASCNNTVSTQEESVENPPMEKKCHHHGDKHCPQMTEEQKAECEAFRTQWNDWANLDDNAKKELITTAKARIDEREAKIKAEREAMEAKKAEMDAKWNNFDNLTLDEQKELLDFKMHCCKPCCKNKCDKKEQPCGGHEKGACPNKPAQE